MHTTRKRSTKPSKRTVLDEGRDVVIPAATKRDAQSEFELRHAGARSPYSCHRKTTADVNGTSSQATPSEAWWRTRSIVARRSSGRRCGLERWPRQRVEHRIGCEILEQDGCARDARYVLRRVTLQPAQGGQRFAPGRATTPVRDMVFKSPVACAVCILSRGLGQSRYPVAVVSWSHRILSKNTNELNDRRAGPFRIRGIQA